jgi:predicted nucleotidyltransferase
MRDDMNPTNAQDQARLELASPPVMALARRKGWELVVVFGSAARGEEPRDVDVAVLTRSEPTLLEQGGWQAELETLWAPRPVDLLLLTPDLSPLMRYRVFRDGRCLFESESGAFERERDRAFFLYADSEWFRRQQREALYGEAR